MEEFCKMIQRDYGLTKKPINTRNPQANGIIERIHQTIGNMICTFQINELELDKEDPWLGIIGSFMFATRPTLHSTNRAIPIQLVVDQDEIINFKNKSDWTYMKNRKDKISCKNNIIENKTWSVTQKAIHALHKEFLTL